jgi:hypothetical protein
MTGTPTNNRHDNHCGGPKRHGGTCTRPAGWGTSHAGRGRCKLHGGTLPNYANKIHLEIAREQANLYGIPRHIHPIDGLMEEYWRTAGILSAYEAHVQTLQRDEIIWGIAEQKTEAKNTVDMAMNADGDVDFKPSPPTTSVTYRAAVNLWIRLLNEERDRFAKLGLEIMRLGLEARRDQYIRGQVNALSGVLLHPALALTDDQRRAAARLLRELDSQPTLEPA